MPAVLFGSVSTLVDTSELQRAAYNRAFARHGLDWSWSQEEYARLLQSSGGRRRIAEEADRTGVQVDAEAVHHTKSALFQESLGSTPLTPRPGVLETVEAARRAGVRVGLVTTTSPENVEALLAGLKPHLDRAVFDVVVDGSSVDDPKPDPAAYRYALSALGEDAGSCVAIEDNLGGVGSATSAGIECIAFPNTNTAGHDFPADRTDRLDADALVGRVA